MTELVSPMCTQLAREVAAAALLVTPAVPGRHDCTCNACLRSRPSHVAPRLQVVESSLKNLHAKRLAAMSPERRAKHAAKVSSRRYTVGS